ncbi:MAG: hypothetical protein LBG15_08770, partial [Dysgonamonadaceae bacterium]|nr:hypothetical protein [Dysgonamonadaceae bacterium]
AEEAMQTIIGHLKFAFEITGKTTQRTEIPEYPLDAIRELLLNALIHRDYKSSTDIQIKIFDQRITFFNPGGLYGDLTEDELKTDAYSASTRNKQLAEAFYLTHDIEKYGSGFTRIRKLITNYPTMTFSFHSRGDGFVSELHYTLQKNSTKGDIIFDWLIDSLGRQNRLITNEGVNPESEGLNPESEGLNFQNEGVNPESEGLNRLFELIKIYPGKRIPFFESELNIPQKTIERWIKKLRNEHKIIYTGSSKTGGYYANN